MIKNATNGFCLMTFPLEEGNLCVTLAIRSSQCRKTPTKFETP